MNENIEKFKLLLSQENIGINIKNVKEATDLLGYLSDIVGADMTSEEVDNLNDVCHAIIAQQSNLISHESSLIITSERLQNKSEFFKKYFNLNLIMLEDLISPTQPQQ